MWLAAADPPGLNEVVIAISGVLVAVVTAIAGVAVAIINSRRSSATPTPESAHSITDDVGFLRERVAILERRSEDSDERDEVQDRRLDQLERFADLDNPNWRHAEP